MKEPTIKELRQMREQIDAKLNLLLAKRNEAMHSIARVMANFDISIKELGKFIESNPVTSTTEASATSLPTLKKRGRKPKARQELGTNTTKTQSTESAQPALPIPAIGNTTNALNQADPTPASRHTMDDEELNPPPNF